MRKRLIGVTLALTMVLALSACGNKNVPDESTTTSNATEQVDVASDAQEIVYENENIKVAQYKGLEYKFDPVEVSDGEIENEVQVFINDYYKDIATDSDAYQYMPFEKMTDEMMKEASSGEYNTIKDYMDAKRTELKTDKEETADDKAKSELFETVVDNSTFVKSEEEIMKTDLYKTYYTEADDYYKDYVSYQGQSWENFLVNYIGVADESEYEDYLKDEAIKNIKSKYVLEAIAENEGITISDEEIEEQIQGFIDTGNYSSRDDVLAYITEEDIKLNLMYHSVTDIIKNNAVDAVLGDTTED